MFATIISIILVAAVTAISIFGIAFHLRRELRGGCSGCSNCPSASNCSRKTGDKQ